MNVSRTLRDLTNEESILQLELAHLQQRKELYRKLLRQVMEEEEELVSLLHEVTREINDEISDEIGDGADDEADDEADDDLERALFGPLPENGCECVQCCGDDDCDPEEDTFPDDSGWHEVNPAAENECTVSDLSAMMLLDDYDEYDYGDEDQNDIMYLIDHYPD